MLRNPEKFAKKQEINLREYRTILRNHNFCIQIRTKPLKPRPISRNHGQPLRIPTNPKKSRATSKNQTYTYRSWPDPRNPNEVTKIMTKLKKSRPISKIQYQSKEIQRSKSQNLKIKTNPKKSRG